MHTETIEKWMHDHTFGQDEKRSGERRTMLVIAITGVTMVVEIIAGIAFGSMALLADGLHMGSHTSALAIAAFAYYYTRRHAKDARFNFGTGKVNSLAGFASAVVLLMFAIVMGWESVERFLSPVSIEFNHAILVAIVGLVVNVVSIVILGGAHTHDHDHAHSRDHGDHNLRAAYVHVLADALTSLLAIFALLGGKFFGQSWLDPFMGIVGAVLIARWSWGLLRSSGHVLLDMQAPARITEGIRSSIEKVGDNRISDLHVWAIGPGIYATEIAVVSSRPLETEGYYTLLPQELGIVHFIVESRKCQASTDDVP